MMTRMGAAVVMVLAAMIGGMSMAQSTTRSAEIPPIDQQVPEKIETATFALG